MTSDRSAGVPILRLAIGLQIVGLVLAIVAIVSARPLAVIAFSGIGAPLIVLGALLYVIQILRELARRGSL